MTLNLLHIRLQVSFVRRLRANDVGELNNVGSSTLTFWIILWSSAATSGQSGVSVFYVCVSVGD